MNSNISNANMNESTENNCSNFRRLASEIATLAASVEIEIRPFHDKHLTHFSKLSADSQINILKALGIYLEVYEATLAEGSSLLDSGRVIWNALTKLGYRPTSDLFSYIKTGNIIEIHDKNLVQVFRNLVFFKFCSYSLEELYCFNLQELYSRDTQVEAALMRHINAIYNGRDLKIVSAEIEPHTISELNSQQLLKIQDRIHFLAPLFPIAGGNEVVATLCIESAEIIENTTTTTKGIKSINEATPLAQVYQFKQRASLDSGHLI